MMWFLKCSLPGDCGLREMENGVCGQTPRSSAETAEREDPTPSESSPSDRVLSSSSDQPTLHRVFFFLLFFLI